MALGSKENLMQDATATTPAPRSLAMRVLIMLLMCIAFQITLWIAGKRCLLTIDCFCFRHAIIDRCSWIEQPF